MFAEGDKVIYMQSHPWNDGGWWTEHPATVIRQSPAGRVQIRLDAGPMRYVKMTSLRAATPSESEGVGNER